MVLACVLPDIGSLKVIRRRLVHFNILESFPTRPAFMVSLLLRPLQKNV